MIDNSKKYLIKGAKTYSKTINLITVESNISKEIRNIQTKWKKTVEIGSYPFFRLGKIGVSIVLRSANKKKIDDCSKKIISFIKKKKIRIIERE